MFCEHPIEQLLKNGVVSDGSVKIVLENELIDFHSKLKRDFFNEGLVGGVDGLMLDQRVVYCL